MKLITRSPSSSSSDEAASVSSTSMSPSHPSFMGKLKKMLSPTRSNKKSEIQEISVRSGSLSPQSRKSLSPSIGRRSVSPQSSSIIKPHVTSSLSIDLHAPKTKDLVRVFEFFDEDKDGKISPTELLNCVKTIGGELTSAEAVTAVESLDSDGDGLLGLEDFQKLMTSKDEEDEKKDLRQAFSMYEMEGSGSITPTSLNRMLNRLGESRTIDECKNIIRTFDLNGDGVLSFEEFTTMMR